MASPKGAPLPTGTDDPDVVGDLGAYATHMDTRVPAAYYTATVTVTVTAATSGTQAVAFPGGLFAGSPRVFLTPVGTTAYGVSGSAVTASGCNVTARHLDNASGTASVVCHLLAVYN
jgi:hypothetical protein